MRKSRSVWHNASSPPPPPPPHPRSVCLSDVRVQSWLSKHLFCQTRVGDLKQDQWVVQCLHQFLALLSVFCHSFACRTDHISQLSIMSSKNAENWLFQGFWAFFSSVIFHRHSGDDSFDHFLPLALSWLTLGCLLKNWRSKQTNQESASTSKSTGSNLALAKMLIVIEGPKLKDIKSSDVIHWAHTEFCSRCERQKFR